MRLAVAASLCLLSCASPRHISAGTATHIALQWARAHPGEYAGSLDAFDARSFARNGEWVVAFNCRTPSHGTDCADDFSLSIEMTSGRITGYECGGGFVNARF